MQVFCPIFWFYKNLLSTFYSPFNSVSEYPFMITFPEIMKVNEQRIEIVRMLQRGKTVMEISRELGVAHGNVSRTLKRFNELSIFEDCQRSGRPRTARIAPIQRSKVPSSLERFSVLNTFP